MARKNADPIKFSTKKCYDCFAHLPLNATVCNVCKKKVGKVNRHGIAEKPTDWKAYAIAAIAFVFLIVFLLKAFGK